MISDGEIQAYVRGGGSQCPHCSSANIYAADPVELDGAEGTLAVECNDCGKTWLEVYTLTGVIER